MDQYAFKTSIKTWAESERPREKLLQSGPKQLSNAELIAILFSTGNKRYSALDLARVLLHSVNHDLDQLSRLRIEELASFPGIGPAKAISLKACFEIAQRMQFVEPTVSTPIRSSQDAFQHVQPLLFDLDVEVFYILLLNRANRVLEATVISQGGVAGTVVDAKLIFQKALDKLASSIILVHNHPSGNLRPSQNDLNITKKLAKGARLLDMHVVDHLIVHQDQYFSFADQGLLPNEA